MTDPTLFEQHATGRTANDLWILWQATDEQSRLQFLDKIRREFLARTPRPRADRAGLANE